MHTRNIIFINVANGVYNEEIRLHVGVTSNSEEAALMAED